MSITVTANLVGGQFLTDAEGDPIEVRNPAIDAVIGHVPAMGPSDVDAVIGAAVAGAEAWKKIGPIERGRILLDAAALIRQDAASLADLIVTEMGKTTAEARGEVGKAAEFFEYYGGLGRAPFGELIPDARPGTFALQRREPIGVVLLITPWNDPLLTPARKMAPALIAGSAVVIKPATETPLITLRLADILHRAGVPAGVLGTVTGRASAIGDILATDPRLAAVSFTGSTSVGLDLQRKLAGSGVRVQTEMGGKNAAVVLADADLDLAVPVIVAGSFGQAGQRCTATSRLIVDRAVADELRERVAAAVAALRVCAGGAAAFRFIDEVDTGQVSVNQPTSGWDIHQPFGGFKESGSPFKEQGLEALRFYTRVKTVAVRTH